VARRRSILLAAPFTLALMLFVSAIGAAQKRADLYTGGSPKAVALSAWGGGKAETSDEQKFNNASTIKVDTRGFYQGGLLTLNQPLALAPFAAAPDRSYIELRVKIIRPAVPAAGAAGTGAGGTQPGMMGPGMMGPGGMGPGMMGPGMMGPGMMGPGMMGSGGMGPGMMGPGMMGPGMMGGAAGAGGAGTGGTPGGTMGPGMMGPGMMGPGMMGPGMMGPGAMGGAAGAGGVGTTPGGTMGPGMMGPGMMGPGGSMGSGMMPPGAPPGMMGPGMMGPGGTMGPGMMGPGMMGPGMMGPGMMGPGGAVGLGAGAQGQTKKQAIEQLRVLLLTDQDKDVDSGPVSLEDYIVANPAFDDGDGWFRVVVPLKQFKALGARAGGNLSGVALFGDAKDSFYVAAVRLVQDPQALVASAGPDRTVRVDEAVTFKAAPQPQGADAKYSWDFDEQVQGIEEDEVGPEVTTRFTVPGEYWVTLTVTSPIGDREPQVDRVHVTVNE